MSPHAPTAGGQPHRARLGREAARGHEAGQGLAELALITPILVLLILAIFQFAFVIESQMGLTNAVREAARRAAAGPIPDTTAVEGQLDALLAANIQGFSGSRVVAENVAIDDYCVAGERNNRVTVSVAYDHPVFFPLLAYATDLVDGVGDGAWTLTASAQMRLETTQNPGTCP